MQILAGMVANPFAIFWSALAVYGCIGLLVAIPFAMAGAHRVLDEPVAMTPGARLAIIPGAIVLWPFVLLRWLRRARQS